MAREGALDHPAFSINHVQFDQACKELHMVQPLGRSLPGRFAVFPQNGRQPQGFEAMVQQDLGGFGHAACPRIRGMQLAADVVPTLAFGR